MAAVPVFVGLWHDYSDDGSSTLTLTLPKQWGAYMVSALAILVSIAGSGMWTIVAYTLHQSRSSHSEPVDVLHLQIQTLLRNDGSPLLALQNAFSIASAWRGTPFRAKRRLIPVISAALLTTIVFKTAAVFVAAIVTVDAQDMIVLANPPNCGFWSFNWTALYQPANATLIPKVGNKLSLSVKNTLDARAYAKSFYSDDAPLAPPISPYPSKRLPFNSTYVPCPFLEDICLSNDTSSSNIALRLDTGPVDSNKYLGVNTPTEDRIQFRRILTCVPVNVSDYLQKTTGADGEIYMDFSQLFPGGAQTLASVSKHRDSETGGYVVSGAAFAGKFKAWFWPNISAFDLLNVDLSVGIIGQNSVKYLEPVYDPLFTATTKLSSGVYIGDNFVNVISCIDQFQFCASAQMNGTCTHVNHILDAYFEALQLNLSASQELALNKTAILLGLIDLSVSGYAIGGKGLLADEVVYDSILSMAIPPDQWQKEVNLWFATGLSQLQSNFFYFLDRIDLIDPGLYGPYLVYQDPKDVISSPEREAAISSCQNQKMVSTGQYLNLRFGAVLIVICFSAAIILVSLVLEPCVRLYRRNWVSKLGRVKQLARTLDNNFWLLRMALESVGGTGWRKGGKKEDSAIPVIDGDLWIFPPNVDYVDDNFYSIKVGTRDTSG